MPRPSQITVTPLHVPSVLVVLDAAWPELFARCLVAAARAGVLVHRCELLSAATFAAERRPVAIVLSNAVHALDPEEFNALARDVQAALLKVDEDVSERELEAMFTGALRERERRDEGGRYAIVDPARGHAPPPSTRALPTAPPPSTRGGYLSPRSFTPPPRSAQPPPSVRAMQPPPSVRAMQPPPSVRAMQPPPSNRRPPIAPAPPGPASPRTPTPVPATSRSRGLPPPAMPPVKTRADGPRSGVRQYAGDSLDDALDEQDLPTNVFSGGRSGSAT